MIVVVVVVVMLMLMPVTFIDKNHELGLQLICTKQLSFLFIIMIVNIFPGSSHLLVLQDC